MLNTDDRQMFSPSVSFDREGVVIGGKFIPWNPLKVAVNTSKSDLDVAQDVLANRCFHVLYHFVILRGDDLSSAVSMKDLRKRLKADEAAFRDFDETSSEGFLRAVDRTILRIRDFFARHEMPVPIKYGPTYWNQHLQTSEFYLQDELASLTKSKSGKASNVPIMSLGEVLTEFAESSKLRETVLSIDFASLHE